MEPHTQGGMQAPSTVVVWDIETDTSFKGLEGMCREQKFQVMQATVICAAVFDAEASRIPGNWKAAKETVELKHWWRDAPCPDGRVFEELLTLFDAADVIVAYNGMGFDLPVMRKYYGSGKKAAARYLAHRLKCFDPMLAVSSAAEIPWPKLDDLLRYNQLSPKIGDGLEAIRLWEAGERQDLLHYCEQDVLALAELVHLNDLKLWLVGRLPNRVHGIAGAIARQRAMAPVPLEMGTDDFVMVEPGLHVQAVRL